VSNEDNEVVEFDLGAIQEAIDNAPDAGFVNQNFGKMTMYPQIVSWGKDSKGARVKHARPMKKGDKAGNGESTEMFFSIDISEFNPALTFAYERNVAIRNSTAKDKSDWTEIVQPSLVATFGSNWLAKAVSHPYVCVEDVANCNGATSKKTGKVITVPKVIATYASAVECKAARDAKYAGAAGADSADAELTAVVDQVKGLITAMGGELEQVHALLTTQAPYNKYDADQLLALAQVAPSEEFPL
jgi:hypothetical protein